MLQSYRRFFIKKTIFVTSLSILFSSSILADSFKFNQYNNHGVVGLINMPSARFHDEGVHGFTFYKGYPDQKITMTASPYDWMEASFFYANIESLKYCAVSSDPVCSQDYKDKGFNFKFRIKKEGRLPALAIGLNDLSGTGLYSSEYIVASYGLNKTDFHFGLGWGTLNGSSYRFKNPLGYLYDGFKVRPDEKIAYNQEDKGGSFSPSRYFSNEYVSPFFGLSHQVNDKIQVTLEYDTTLTPGVINYDEPKSDYSYGIDYFISDNFVIGFSNERGTHSSVKFLYKLNAKSYKSEQKLTKIEHKSTDNKYTKFIKNVEQNGIGVNKIIETSDSIGVELTSFMRS